MTLNLRNKQENLSEKNNLATLFSEMDELRKHWGELLIPKIKKIFWEKTYGYEIELIAIDLFDKLYAQCKDNSSKSSRMIVEFLPSDHWGIEGINEAHKEIRGNIISAGGTAPTHWLDGYRLHLEDQLYVTLNGNWTGAYGTQDDIAQNKLILTFTYSPTNWDIQEELLEALLEERVEV